VRSRPADTEYAAFFSGYIALVPESDVLTVLGNQPAELAQCSSLVPAEREGFRYAEGKWTIREVFGHLIDAERVFSYRAFCISRGEEAPLPGFDENEYVRQSQYDDQSLGDLVSEFAALREGTMAFIHRLDNHSWERIGTANRSATSVRALAFIMAGHVRHHLIVLRDRYGVLPGRNPS
jgi:hypothetical protein